MPKPDTDAEVREAEARNAASLLAGHLMGARYAATDALAADPGRAAEAMEDADLAESIAHIQQARRELGDVERDLTTALGKRLGKTTGELADGRMFTLERSADRKEWQHDDWQRDLRRVIQKDLEDFVTVEGELVDATTGEAVTIGLLVQEAITRAQLVHGSTSPRVRAMRDLGLFASDYCTSTPGAWRFSAIAPHDTTEETRTDA